MKKIIILICGLLITSAAVFAQCQKTSFQDLQKTVNSKGTPVYLLGGKPFTGMTYDEYDANEIYRKVTIEDGQIQKEAGWYYNGEKEREFSFQDGVLHGKLLMYHRNGNVYLEENYGNGVTEGKQYRYNCDGSLEAEWDCGGGFTLMKLQYEKKKCTANCKFDEC